MGRLLQLVQRGRDYRAGPPPAQSSPSCIKSDIVRLLEQANACFHSTGSVLRGPPNSPDFNPVNYKMLAYIDKLHTVYLKLYKPKLQNSKN